ncbi:MAG: hypothetical protein HY094_06845 [Candidatus Melainabacteria bacterium]|nr:hypothetical protein [Candidatus Melainabacteria bacterium]
MNISWLSHLTPGLISNRFQNVSTGGKITVLDFQQYPQLQTLKNLGASDKQLEKCQLGFDLFKQFERFGWKDYSEKLTDGCFQIIETRKALPQHLSVLFGTAGYLIRYNLLKENEISDLAKWQASLIKNNLNPRQVQRATWNEYVVKRTSS